MRGCFNTIGEPLARSFISTTTGWSKKSNRTTTPVHHYWVNDRHLPIYKRADRIYSILNAAKIDHVIFDELSSMKNTDIAKYGDDSSSSNHTVAAYYRNTYDPLLHLEQLTLQLELDYDSVHPMAFQHLASQIQMDHTPRAIVGWYFHCQYWCRDFQKFQRSSDMLWAFIDIKEYRVWRDSIRWRDIFVPVGWQCPIVPWFGTGWCLWLEWIPWS